MLIFILNMKFLRKNTRSIKLYALLNNFNAFFLLFSIDVRKIMKRGQNPW
jgi:hypothetical protein